MTTYITEGDIRSCFNNSLTNIVTDSRGNKTIEYPFIHNPKLNPPITYNSQYNFNQANSIKILDILDTFHDLAKDRGAYDASLFVDNIANYLMTGAWFSGDYIEFYKIQLNYPEYASLKGFSTFESRVAASFEIHNGLQRADITITYNDIINNFLIGENGKEISPEFKQTIIHSNGSIIIKPNLNENISFEAYKCELLAAGHTNERVNEFMLKISSFIKWYLHSADFIPGSDGRIPILSGETFKPTVPPQIRFVFDAVGMGGIFDIAGSGGTAHVGAFSVMDSASTSSNLLDPDMGTDYEIMPHNSNGDGLIVPILSNYFSCNNIFIGYLQNPKKIFGQDGIFCFSLVMFKIPKEENIPQTIFDEINRILSTKNKADINNLQNSVFTSLQKISPTNSNNQETALNILTEVFCDTIKKTNDTELYEHAQQLITLYVETNPAKIVRYYFGEVEKDMTTNDNSKCGTCGAGVAYLGKVFDKIKKSMETIQKVTVTPPMTVPTVYSSQPMYATIEQLFNELKMAGDLRQRIPIADARILKLFFESVGITVTGEDMLLLFKVLADYKRTGDYQQVYAVLRAILKTGTNDGNYTHATGDELAALFARMIGLPCVYQVSSIGKNTLYRSTVYMVNTEKRAQQEVDRKISVIRNFYNETAIKIQTVMNFLKLNYTNIYTLKEQLKELVQKNPTPTPDNLLLASGWDTLNKLLTFSNTVLTDFNKLEGFYTKVTPLLSQPNITTEQNLQITEALHLMDIASNIPFSFLIDYIQENFPSLSLLNNEIDPNENIFLPLTETEKTSVTFNRPSLNLIFTKGKSKNKIINTFRTYTEEVAASSSSRSSSRSGGQEIGKYIDAGAKARITQAFNNFSMSLHMDDIEKEKSTVSEPKEIKNKISEIFQTYNVIISKDESSGKTAFNLTAVEAQFNELQKLFQSPEQHGGKKKSKNDQYSIVQVQRGGGPEQVQNRNIIYMKVKQIVITLFEKCNNYLLDVTQSNIKNVPDIVITNPNDLMKINNRYDVDKFCKETLLNVNEDIDDIGNEGILTSLQNVASSFTSHDINEDGDESVLTVSKMLDDLGLTEVKWLMYMLSVNTITDPASGTKLDMTLSTELKNEIQLQTIPGDIQGIYETVKYNQILTLFCFSILYKFYNGKKSYLGNSFINTYSQNLFTKFNSKGTGIPENGLSTMSNEIFLRGLISRTSLSSSSTAQLAAVNSANLPSLLMMIIQEIITSFNIIIPSSYATRALTKSPTSSSSSKSNPYAKAYKSSSTSSSRSARSASNSPLGTRKKNMKGGKLKRNKTRKLETETHKKKQNKTYKKKKNANKKRNKTLKNKNKNKK